MQNSVREQLELLRNDLKEKEAYYIGAQKKGHSYEALYGLKLMIENLKKEIAVLEKKNKEANK